MDFSRFKTITFFGALLLATAAFLYLLRPFTYPILWAAIIAGIFYPLYKRIRSRINRPNLAALLSVVIIFFIIIIPVVILSSLILKESLDVYTSLINNQDSLINASKNIINWIQNNPILDVLKIDKEAIISKITNITDVARTVATLVFAGLKNFTVNSVTFVVMSIIMFYTLFFFLRDGEKILRRLAHLSPLGEKHEEAMYTKFTSTARAVLKGTLIIGGIQGLLLGMLFYTVGIEGPLIWGIIGMLLSIIPGFGSYFIWLPAAFIMFALGNIWQGVLILIIGGFVISLIDNFLRPILVGKDTQMHPLLIFLSTFGGLAIFNISGFILGPIIAALFLSLWEMYEQYYRQELDNDIHD